MNARLSRFWGGIRPWLVPRLRQPSTYAGLLLKLSALAGLTVTDSAIGQLAEVLAVIVGAALVAYDQTPPGDDTDHAGV